MSGSGCMGVAGVVSAIVWGLVVGHVLCGAGEKWRCGRSVLITSWGRSESCTFGFMFVMCQVVCLASGCAGENDVADIALGVRALGCAMVAFAVGTGVGILECW